MEGPRTPQTNKESKQHSRFVFDWEITSSHDIKLKQKLILYNNPLSKHTISGIKLDIPYKSG